MCAYNASQTNYLSYKFVESNFERFCSIIKPLINLLNLHHFCYLKMYRNSTYISFSNSLKWQKFYFQNIKDNYVILPGEFPLLYAGKDNQYMISTWPTISGATITKEVLKRDFGDGICITRYTNEYSERWGLFKDPSGIRLDVLCIQHLNLILKFLDYFYLSTKDLFALELHDEYKLAKFKHGIIYPDSLPAIVHTGSIDNFLKEISTDQVNLSHIQIGQFRLTKREFESLSQLAKGKSIKEIARELGLSPRTIEDYLKKIKFKTGYHLKSDLVKLFQDKFH